MTTRGLREPRPGYFTYVTPSGSTVAIGRVPRAVAEAEVAAANAHYAGARPSLVAKLTATSNTVSMLLDRMPVPENANSAKQRRAQDKVIREGLGERMCADLTVADCADLLEPILAAGHARMAEAVRARLVTVCRRGQQLGWMPGNPAEVTARPRPAVQRGRLTLTQFWDIYEVAPHVAKWLQPAMKLAIVTGVDRLTLSRLTKLNVGKEHLTFQRPKTGKWIKVPLVLELKALGWTLADAVNVKTGVLSKHLVHHVDVYGNAPAGEPVHVDTISAAFTAARRLAGIPDVLRDGTLAPTFHEIRSLAKREYVKQGGVDTLALLGHTDEKTGEIYADGRGVEPVMVRVG